MLEPDVMKGLMEEMGIGDDTLVVAYDNSGSLNSARFWWVLNYYGHTNVKVLNGGWKKWFDEGRPTSIDRPPDVGEVTFTPRSDDSLVCTLDYGTGTGRQPGHGVSWTSAQTRSGTAPTAGATREPAGCLALSISSGST